ncbi:nucleotidyltransferase domain-containing protein [Mucilaginibacter daejeonensis]|uniref:nucleotidyltransferase domain-containing protein n=1 Tax=Mucilaginibacter daejeonensis TaxID=398049 RepID=UPI001D17832E|nr:nucleotidyltransferase domain-containing protein [Mucilaginibacter daejeonensis]UEG54848.1 nucleotidyltransferase domain-containing protein [Mucilaginibacter daejeonensis]
MNETIRMKLLELEQLHHIKILYACESGSRAWGFASPDSDFDVRFIYARRMQDYLRIADTPDTLGLPVNEVLDISGWDVRKALQLFLKSNSPLYEWLQSPIVYQEDNDFTSELKAMMPQYFSPKASANHYLSMSHNTLMQDLQAEQVKLKRYFYALRPALACLWVVQEKRVPPMEFEPLRILIKDDTVQKAIDVLMLRKQAADENALIAPVNVLNDWLTSTLTYCKEQMSLLNSTRRTTEELDDLFRRAIT